MRRDPVKSAARTLEILELFTLKRRPLRLVDILDSLAYPQSSMTQLLKTVVGLGYLNYDRRSRTYFPTPRVAALGGWIDHQVFGDGELLDIVRTVFDQVDETVIISTQNDIYTQDLRVFAGPDVRDATSRAGMPVLTRSPAGLAFLSGLSASRVDAMVRQIAYYENERVDRAILAGQLQGIRDDGYCMLCGSPSPDTSSIAVVVPNSPNGAPLAIAVRGFTNKIADKKSHILRVMRDAIAAYLTTVAAPEAQSRPA